MTDLICQQYVVAIIDVLGQKERLLKLDHKPITNEEHDGWHETAGYIQSLRGYFENYFENAKQHSGILDNLNEKNREIAEKIRGTDDDISMRYFSDSIIFEIPIEKEDEFCTTARQIYKTLFALCGVFIMALVSKKPVRGGVDFGWGVALGEKKEVYGPALVKAHILENEIAEHPRIVIGDSLWEYLNYIKSIDKSDSIYSKTAKKFAEYAIDLFDVDFDKLRILDVIGKSFKSTISFDEQVNSAYDNVIALHEYHSRQGDIQLSSRYGLLRTYFESRIGLWR